MSLQANINAMLGSIAALKKLGGIQKGVEGTKESIEELQKRYEASGQAAEDAANERYYEATRVHDFEQSGAGPPRSNAEAADRAQQHIQDADTAPNSGAELRERFARERERFSVAGQAYPFMVPGQVVPGTIRPGTISAPSSYRTQRGADISNSTGGNT